jgi:hypothetical protein
MRRRTKGYVGFTVLGQTALCAWQVHAWASDSAGFPDGYDAVQAARPQGDFITSLYWKSLP